MLVSSLATPNACRREIQDSSRLFFFIVPPNGGVVDSPHFSVRRCVILLVSIYRVDVQRDTLRSLIRGVQKRNGSMAEVGTRNCSRRNITRRVSYTCTIEHQTSCSYYTLRRLSNAAIGGKCQVMAMALRAREAMRGIRHPTENHPCLRTQYRMPPQ
jgi:hypothetical protein